MRMISAMMMALAALLASMTTQADTRTRPAPLPPPASFPAPSPALESTQLRIVPPEHGAVTIADGDNVLGHFGLSATLAVATGKAYDVVATRGTSVLWRSSVVATGGTVEMAWGAAAAPVVRVIPPKVVVTVPSSPGKPTGPFVPPPPRGMKRGAFHSLIALLESTSFSSDKLDVVETAAERNRFTVAQVGEILDTLDFSSDRLSAVKTLRDRIVDPENAFLLAAHFDFSTDKEKVAAMFER
ncbi:DUF4476 domain-containing protein [Polyangium aurulentum]|uniref:DUF4476 domain-containing protein n=1 Tax=Polyangium aurulentum TaxID=2567896 RepID=UPI0010AE2F89|nr:DUF4476 domain-containing protein [Polyangium aurulentum]UQA61726.1 DUF4476 domain-containing protein [Polyangium aurulentum]